MNRLWIGLSCLTLTCARPDPLAHAEASGKPLVRAAHLSKAPAPAHATLPATLPTVEAAKPTTGPLRTFFDALQALEHGTRHGHVRVLWLGDSHTNADFLSGAVRSALGQRFGDGGPGFLRLGTKPYRHEGVKVVRDGNWNVDPDPPARRALQDDGVFGLSGTRAEPKLGASFSLQVTARGDAATAPARFDLSYTVPRGSSFGLKWAEHEQSVGEKTPADSTCGGVRHLSISAPLGSELTVSAERGVPRLFGVVAERTDKAGVVLDTLGIDGARIETPLAWNEDAFVAEVALRAPELVVIAYGTNEAFDAVRVDKYGPQLAALVQRTRRGSPNASCLVLGPTDAPLGDGSVPRVAEVASALQRAAAPLGCSFVSLQQLMGGEGSFARGMKAKERLAQLDKLHLTPKGYQELGRALSQQLLDAYSAGRADL